MKTPSGFALLVQNQEDPVDELATSLAEMWETTVASLPRVGVAVGVLLFFIVVSRLLKWFLEPRLMRMRTPSFGRVSSTLVAVGVVFTGLLVALPIAFPSVNVAAMLGGLGLLGVAAGFAFQDILSNLLAGILLIFRQPFRSGDQIAVEGYQGSVEEITVRETRIRTFDGRLVVIPNKDVYTNAFEVQTHFPSVRTSLIVGVAYGTDLRKAQQVAVQAMTAVGGVLDRPAPEAYYVEFGDSSINLDLRYWTTTREAQIRNVMGEVVQAVHRAFGENEIDIPFTVITIDNAEELGEYLRT